MSKKSFKTPKGELKWAFLDGQGRTNLNGLQEFSITVHVPEEEAQEGIDEIEAFWAENKPKGAKLKSLGFKIEDGVVIFNLKTRTEYADGKEKVIRLFDHKAKPLTLPEGVRVGNGSRGKAAGIMAIYDAGPAARGVTLYLDAVQVTKLVEYAGGETGFEVEEDENEDVEMDDADI